MRAMAHVLGERNWHKRIMESTKAIEVAIDGDLSFLV
jgi:hypothetical protein